MDHHALPTHHVFLQLCVDLRLQHPGRQRFGEHWISWLSITLHKGNISPHWSGCCPPYTRHARSNSSKKLSVHPCFVMHVKVCIEYTCASSPALVFVLRGPFPSLQAQLTYQYCMSMLDISDTYMPSTNMSTLSWTQADWKRSVVAIQQQTDRTISSWMTNDKPDDDQAEAKCMFSSGAPEMLRYTCVITIHVSVNICQAHSSCFPCVLACLYVCVHACMCGCMYTRILQIVTTRTHTYKHMYAHMHACMYYVHMSCVFIRKNAYFHMIVLCICSNACMKMHTGRALTV